MRLSLVFSWLTAILLVVPVHDLRGQDLNYRHYTAESGNNLPSNEVYGIIFDRNHILWATTDRGVWRYDGYTGRQFTVADGLKENNHLRIYTDTLGRIWLSSFTNRLYRIINDSVSKHPCSDSIQNLPFNGGYIQQVGEGADGSLYLTFNRPGLYRLQPGKAPVQLAGHRRSAASGTLAIFYTPELTYWDMIDYPDPDEGIATRVETRDGWTYLTCGLNNPDKSYRKYIWPLARNEFLFSYGNRVFHLRDGKLLAERILPFDVQDVYADQQNNFWVGVDEGGALRFSGRSLNSDPVR